MNLRVLDHNADGNFAKSLRRLISAQRAYHLLVGIIHHLEALEANQEETTQFVKPVIEHALVSYVSIFNSGNPGFDGIGKYNSGQVAFDADGLEMHQLLCSYRDKEIAHLTDFSQKTLVLVNEQTRELHIRGTLHRDQFCNVCQPGTDLWRSFLNHLHFTREWFKGEVERLEKRIAKVLKKCHDSFFQNLTEAPPLPTVIENLASFLSEHGSKS